MYGLSLKEAPDYKILLFYYMVASLYLLLFCIALFLYQNSITTRYNALAIATTHIFTVGFLTNVMFGSLFQIMPVVLTAIYKNVNLLAIIIFVGLNSSLVGFVFGFINSDYNIIKISILSLFLVVFLFIFISIKIVIKIKDKDQTIKTLLASFVFIILALLFAIFRYNQLHVIFISFGWLFLFVSAILYKVITMFYVTKEYPKVIKNGLYIVVSTLLIIFVISYHFNINIEYIIKILLASIAIFFAYSTILLLKNRKRARRDITINFWYISMINLIIFSVVWLYAIILDKNLDFIIGFLFSIGFIYPLLNGMLYKIIPFLTWFHLSSNGIFEAEMSQVIKTKIIKIQYNIFIISYIFFIFSFLIPQIFKIAIIIFFISSSLLLYNIVTGYRYYKSYKLQ